MGFWVSMVTVRDLESMVLVWVSWFWLMVLVMVYHQSHPTLFCGVMDRPYAAKDSKDLRVNNCRLAQTTGKLWNDKRTSGMMQDGRHSSGQGHIPSRELNVEHAQGSKIHML